MERHIAGSTLWNEWQGEGFEPFISDCVIFYTTGHVNLDDEFIRTSLALALQQSGIVESRGEANKALLKSEIHYGYAGEIDEDVYLAACDSSGETFYGDKVEDLRDITWVEVPIDD